MKVRLKSQRLFSILYNNTILFLDCAQYNIIENNKECKLIVPGINNILLNNDVSSIARYQVND